VGDAPDADPPSRPRFSSSAYIESVRSVEDPNPVPAGLHYESVIVTTPQREMKFTATNKERHDLWFRVRPY
jgi:hypothetical protein